MSVRNLQYLLAPRSVAVIGASQKRDSVGGTVLRNLLQGGFKGAIYPVNPKYAAIGSQKTYRRVADLPTVPDLAVICTPPATIPQIVSELGARGTKAAIILAAGLSGMQNAQGHSLRQAVLGAARPHSLRILGPNSVGVLAPGIGLNASFAYAAALPGHIAFVSQSGALGTGVLDWARSRGIGFSRFISLGDSADVDIGDVLDYLAGDGTTQAILLYVEDIRRARKFMSAARVAARSKPTLVLKAGRAPEGAKAAALHTGARAGSDEVYDAAIRRAGMLRVFSTEDLFSAVETLARAGPLQGDRLTIVTNGGGPGVMATDALICGQGKLAELSSESLARLDQILPPTWSRGNPVDILGDATAERYRQTMEVLLHDPQIEALLFIHAPTAIVSSIDIANAVVPLARNAGREFIACWLGGDAVAEARKIFSAAGIPTYDTPEEAVHVFLKIVQYRRNQTLLMQVPPSIPADFAVDRLKAQAAARDALAAGRQTLSAREAKAMLAAYGIEVVASVIAETVEEAMLCAQQIGFPVAVKILSPDIRHKSDVGGVELDLETPEAVRAAAEAMHKRLHLLRPAARLQGFSIQAMVRRKAHELRVGASTDPTFGPIILFGQGGLAVDVMDDRAVGLPPLNMVLARDMVSQTRVSRLLAGYRNRLPADIGAICRTLIQVSQLVTDIPEVIELDINSLLADSRGVIALDAEVRVARAADAASNLDRLAIRPYPEELEQIIEWQGQPLLLRPIMPEDGEAHIAFFNALDPEDVRYRLFSQVRELQLSQLARFTQIDYDREMAFIATREGADGRPETLGVARVVVEPNDTRAEFAVIVRSDLKGRGLASLLMQKLIDYCRGRGIREIVGESLSHNTSLLRLARKFGFEVMPGGEPGDGSLQLRLALEAR